MLLILLLLIAGKLGTVSFISSRDVLFVGNVLAMGE